jgi:hypothetical protein
MIDLFEKCWHQDPVYKAKLFGSDLSFRIGSSAMHALKSRVAFNKVKLRLQLLFPEFVGLLFVFEK